MTTLTVGIDLATADARAVALQWPGGQVVARAGVPLPTPQRSPDGSSQQEPAYGQASIQILRALADQLGDSARAVTAISVSATSGTLAGVDDDGHPLGLALLYDDRSTNGTANAPAAGRVRRLQQAGRLVATAADVALGALTDSPVPGDLSHWLKAGVDLQNRSWRTSELTDVGVDVSALPALVMPSTVIGALAGQAANATGLPAGTMIVAGMTDGCTAQIACGAVQDGDTMAVLGTTLVLKAVSPRLVVDTDSGLYSHLAPDGKFWAGGASNTGGGALAAHFTGNPAALDEQSQAVTTDDLLWYPLARPGERFPVLAPALNLPPTDPDLSAPVLYRAGLEGVAFVERLALQRLSELGITSWRHRLTGGGARSPLWSAIRAAALAPLVDGPILRVNGGGSAVGAAVLAAAGAQIADLDDLCNQLPLNAEPITPDPAAIETLDRKYAHFLTYLDGHLTESTRSSRGATSAATTH